jgi:TRAP-type C4-dicarboxylate transport system permease small subunit
MATGSSNAAFSKALDAILKVMVTATLLCMATITFLDVVGRYLFNAPIPGAFEIQEFGMAILIFSGLPLVTKSRGHITVSLFDALFRRHPMVHRAKVFVVNLAASGILAFVTFCLYRQSMNFWQWGSTSAFLEMPHYPVAIFMTLMSAVSSLILATYSVTALLAATPEPETTEKGELL